MQKFFIITAFILLSSVAAAAQTAAEPKPAEAGRSGMNAPAVSIMSAKGAQTERIVDGRVVRVGPTSTYLKNGLSVEEVVKLLGKPTGISEQLEDGKLLTIYAFPRSQGRVLIAQFENGILTDSRMESRPIQ